ncbi:MBL fold metallo-hydrolase [Avibacterium sp. 20-15]|uniref:MBL fold metallo-hydrolase n=1 Tax=unclassified Avibacterium TaxID=2685287 RepID=UPI0020269A80|nr:MULTISPECIES: MBL fold metallo-hydrolase [unclassified Avibacterium]MCW9731978.1 MBL fold metallo-hydrolase [Avibacterium sp. 20-15]URL04165.1 MBL fold metallo-hydrolase [Avibacterium sp. 20-132]
MNAKKTALAAFFILTSAFAHAELKLETYQADQGSFNVTSTLITGEKEAVLIDSGFTRADALRIAAKILDSGKTLTTIFISQADPDYYFGVETLKAQFPQAKVVTTPAVLQKIEAKLPKKVAFWSPKMGENAPKHPVLPEALTDNRLTLEGDTIEIKGTEGLLAHRPYVWIPSLKAITGNIAVFGKMHVWTADSQSKAERKAWIKQLDEMKALKPKVVIAGHSATVRQDVSNIDFTKSYLQQFEQNLAQSKNSADLIQKMQKAYPNLPATSNLELGAQVATGEMKW